MKKRIAVLLSLLMMLSVMPSVLAAEPPNFSDVPTSHWAFEEIEKAADAGIVNGYGDGTFRPSGTVTNAHFATMIARTYFPAALKQQDALPEAQTNWWYGAITTCDSNGILDGTKIGRQHSQSGEWPVEVGTAMNRYDMAQILYNLLQNYGATLPSVAEQSAVQDSIADWDSIPSNYRTAVAVCYASDLLNGLSDGTFGGERNMNRAQACVVLNRLSQRLTVPVDNQSRSWTRVVNGKTLSYVCSLDETDYQTYPAWRPTWDADEWGLVSLNQEQRDSSWASWQYQYGKGSITFHCSYPTDASFGRIMQTEAAAENYQQIPIQGYMADFYTDGDNYLLAWENEDGVLFMLDGNQVSADVMRQVAESVKPYTGTEISYALDWLPSGYSYFDQVSMNNAVQSIWTSDDRSLVLLYSTDPVAVPDGNSETVSLNGTEANFWEATVDSDDEDNSQSGENTSSSSATIPGLQSKEYSTLAWTDPETGISFRLQSKESLNTMVKMAKNIE